MRRLGRFLKEYKYQVILGPVFKLIEAIFELIVPLVMADMIDSGVATGDIGYVWRKGLLILGLGIVGLGCSLTCQWLASVASQGVGTSLRSALFAHIQTLSHKEIDAFGTPTLVTRMTNDINQLQLAVAMLIRLVVRAPFLAIGAIIMAFGINHQLALIFVAVVPLVAIILYFIMGRSIPYYKIIQQKLDKIGLITRENLGGARVVRAFGMQKSEKARFDEASDDQAGVAIRINKLSALLSPLTAIILNLGIVAIIWFGGHSVNAGGMTQGQIIALVNYMGQILLALVVVANLVIIFTRAGASASRINQLFDTKPSVTQAGERKISPRGPYSISFKNVSFAYDGDINDGKYAISDIDFNIKKGSTLGIIGGTGSGKSTIVQLIPRLYDATMGEVLIDGVNVKDYSFGALRAKIGMVPQSAVLFSGTISENLRWRKENATETEMIEALSIAQALDFVMGLPDQLQSRIEQNGRNLSGGQRQRLTIARALVGSPEILILDDSASALDYATDSALRKAIGQEIINKNNATVILVSQRVSTVKNSDCIIVMEEGRMAGMGSHSELMQSNALYQEIAASQDYNQNYNQACLQEKDKGGAMIPQKRLPNNGPKNGPKEGETL